MKGELWINGRSTYNGDNDQVPEAEAVELKSSLLLVKPSNLTIEVAPEGGVYAPARRRVRADFSLNGLHYNFVLTDAAMERKFLKGPNGSFPINDALLCISLGEVFQDHAYKLAAALITPDRLEENDG